MPKRKHASRRRGKKGRIDNKRVPKRRILPLFEIDDREDCPSVHPGDGTRCERKVGHDPEYHWYTVWGPEIMRDDVYGDFVENHPLYPVIWGNKDLEG
jgi:hypothetical protein